MASKPKAGRRDAAPSPTPVCIWDTAIVPFLTRRAYILLVALLLIASARIVSTYHELSLTFDEPAHLACGMEYVAHHVYRYESQHPPLSRAMVGLGLVTATGTEVSSPAHQATPSGSADDLVVGAFPSLGTACNLIAGTAPEGAHRVSSHN